MWRLRRHCHKGNGPTEKEISGRRVLSSLEASSSRYHSIYVIVTFFLFYRTVFEPEGTQRNGGVIGSLALYIAGDLRYRRWRRAAWKPRYRPRVKFSLRRREVPVIGHPIEINTVLEGMKWKEPRRAAKRKEDLKID